MGGLTYLARIARQVAPGGAARAQPSLPAGSPIVAYDQRLAMPGNRDAIPGATTSPVPDAALAPSETAVGGGPRSPAPPSAQEQRVLPIETRRPVTSERHSQLSDANPPSRPKAPAAAPALLVTSTPRRREASQPTAPSDGPAKSEPALLPAATPIAPLKKRLEAALARVDAWIEAGNQAPARSEEQPEHSAAQPLSRRAREASLRALEVRGAEESRQGSPSTARLSIGRIDVQVVPPAPSPPARPERTIPTRSQPARRPGFGADTARYPFGWRQR